MMARSSSYDQFTFMDSLTNRTIAVKDMRRICKKKIRVKGKVRASSEEIQLKELDQCIDLLKSASNFQKKNLRDKLFGRSGEIEEQPLSKTRMEEGKAAAVQKKRLIRELISKTLS